MCVEKHSENQGERNKKAQVDGGERVADFENQGERKEKAQVEAGGERAADGSERGCT